MGSMSASDAAPLPRLGEVYFDVRGESRSMRLSWYADTGVAVFSIWQGGTCTGTFRLPIADLPRMIQALQRGPDGDDVPEPPAAGQAQRGSPPRAAQPATPDGGIEAGPAAPPPQRARSGRHHGDERAPADHGAEPTAAAPAGGYSDGRRTGGHRAGGYADAPAGPYREPEAGAPRYEERPAAGYSDEPTSPYREPEAGAPRYEERPAAGYSDEPTSLYREPEAGAARYEERPTRGYPDAPGGRYREPDEAGTDRYEERPAGGYPDAPGGRYREPDAAGRYEERSTGGYPDGSHRRGYQDERPGAYHGGGYEQEATGPYPDDSLPGSAGAYHGEDPHGGFEREPARRHSGGFEREPAQRYSGDPLDTSRPLDTDEPLGRGDRRERYEPQRTAPYSRGGYEDEPTGIYRGDMLSQDFDDRPAGRYPDPVSPDYPTGPSGPVYQGGDGPRDYPPPPRDADYPPAGPYADPRSRDGGPPAEGRARSRHRDDDHESFPYGPAHGEHEVRGRAR
jgi:hypothetical protein